MSNSDNKFFIVYSLFAAIIAVAVVVAFVESLNYDNSYAATPGCMETYTRCEQAALLAHTKRTPAYLQVSYTCKRAKAICLTKTK